MAVWTVDVIDVCLLINKWRFVRLRLNIRRMCGGNLCFVYDSSIPIWCSQDYPAPGLAPLNSGGLSASQVNDIDHADDQPGKQSYPGENQGNIQTCSCVNASIAPSFVGNTLHQIVHEIEDGCTRQTGFDHGHYVAHTLDFLQKRFSVLLAGHLKSVGEYGRIDQLVDGHYHRDYRGREP